MSDAPAVTLSDIQNELRGLRTEVQGVRVELRGEIQGLRSDMREDFRRLRARQDRHFSWLLSLIGIVILIGLAASLLH
jgi:hypothetical protein